MINGDILAIKFYVRNYLLILFAILFICSFGTSFFIYNLRRNKMKNIRKIKIITKDTEDNTDIQIYKEFIALMKDILIEIKRDDADK